MEDTIQLGSVGSLVLGFSGGKASIAAQDAVDSGNVAFMVTITVDAAAFIDQLEAIVAKAIPATSAIDPAIFAAIKLAVTAL